MMIQDLTERRLVVLAELDLLTDQVSTAPNQHHRDLYLLMRQARIIELGAIERFLGMNQTVQAKSQNRKRWYQNQARQTNN